MTFPEVQFVAAPEDGAQVLFDFNENFTDAPSAVVHGSFNLGTPSIEGDPDGLGVQYGAREASFSLLIYGNRHAAMQTQALLARTFMLRRRGWLRVRIDELSSPVWLRTYTPTPSELDFSLIAPDSEVDAWQLEVTVAAEPFIRGERIELWSGTINNDPTHATNPMGVNLPAVIGDAPAPLRIEAAFSGAMDRHDVAWSCAAVPDEFTPIVWPIGGADGWTAGPDTSASTVIAGAVGGSSRTVDFATTPGMVGRLAATTPGAVPPAGHYRVFLRTGRLTTGVFAVQFDYNTTGQLSDRSSRVVLDRDEWTWLDLGSFEFPFPSAGVDFPSVTASPNVVVGVELVSGSPTAILDALMLIPESVASVTSLESWEKSDLLVSEFSSIGPTAGQVQMWDGDAEVTVAVTVDGGLNAHVGAADRGKFPTVRPGIANRLSLIQQARAAASDLYPNPDLPTQTATVSVSYQPRWLWLGDA